FMRLINHIARQLWEPTRQETQGDRLFFRIFELFVIGYVIGMAWEWALYMDTYVKVVLPLGLANYIDISFLFDHSLALLNAALISVLVILSYFRKGFKWQYLLALLLFHLQHVARYSQGDIDHSSNLIGMALLCFGIGFV